MANLPPLDVVELQTLESFRLQFGMMTSQQAMNKAKEFGILHDNTPTGAEHTTLTKEQYARQRLAYIAYSFLLEREEATAVKH